MTTQSLLRKAHVSRSLGSVSNLGVTLSSVVFQNSVSLIPQKGGLLSAQMEQGLFDTFRFQNTVKGKANGFHNYL